MNYIQTQKTINNTISIEKLLFLLGDVSLYLYVFLTFFLDIIFYNPILTHIKTIFLLLGGISGYLNSFKKFNKKVLIFIFLLIVSYFAVYFSGKPLIKHTVLIYSLMHIGLALNLMSHKHSPNIASAIFHIGSSAMILKILLHNKNSLDGYMLSGLSENYISILAILLLGLYVITLEQNQLNISYPSAILFLFLTLCAHGRGGILAGTLFIILKYLSDTQKLRNSNKKIAIIFFIFLLICSILGIFMTPIGNRVFNKFIQRGNITKDSRIIIWTMFFRNTLKSSKTIILGGNINTAAHEDGNLHNSFLLCYGNYGLLLFLSITILYIKYIVSEIFCEKQTLLIFAIILFVRANTDKVFFQGYNEFYLYYIIFSSLLTNRITDQYNKRLIELKELKNEQRN